MLKNKKLIVSNYCNIYTFCEEGKEQEGLNKAIQANEKDISLYQKHLVNYPERADYWKEQLEQAQNKTYSVMTWEEFNQYEKGTYLKGKPKEISEEQFNDALNVLPPLKWCTINGIEEFLMSEFYTDSYTNQYARKGSKYYVKMVDAKDKSTWLHNLLA